MGRRLAGVVNGLAVSAYKLVGLVALGGILLGLLGYLGVQGLFLFDRSWVAPAIVSPTDPNVLQLNAQLAQHAAARERLVAERRELKVRLEDAERQIAAADRFLERFRVAARGDREAQRRQLRRLEAIRAEHERAGEEIAASNRAYSGMSRVRAEELRSASLIDRERYLTANQQLAELAKVNLGLEETRLQLDGQAETLAREVRGLSAILEGVGSAGARGTWGPSVIRVLLQIQRGGPPACRSCSRAQPPSSSSTSTIVPRRSSGRMGCLAVTSPSSTPVTFPTRRHHRMRKVHP